MAIMPRLLGFLVFVFNSTIRPQQISRWMHFYMRGSHLDVNLIPSAESKTQTKRPSVALLLLTINPTGLYAGLE